MSEGEEDETFSEVSPATRYELHGAFEIGWYEEDLKLWSGFFDENGWPRFGNYDPLTLFHPITERPWYECPRVPTEADEDSDYIWWFELAIDFNSFPRLAARPRRKRTMRPDAYSQRQSREELIRTIRVLKKNLKDDLLRRNLSAEFVCRWASLVEADCNLLAIVWTGRKAYLNYSLDKQRSWLALSQKRLQVEGHSAIAARRILLDYIYEVVRGIRSPPKEFAPGWFAKMLKSERGKPVAEFTDSFKRTKQMHGRLRGTFLTAGLPPFIDGSTSAK